MKRGRKVILVIRDGWGYRKSCKSNAICQAGTPHTDRLMKDYPHTLLKCSGEAVGLPPGYQGNSEVGHMTIGAGRIIFQSLARINQSIADKSFFRNPAFLGVIKNCQKHHSTLHLIGLLQVEGVHSHLNHLLALLDLCKKKNFHQVYIHAITDGRDAPVTDSLKHLKKLQQKLKKLGFGKIVTVSGRYYALDRDKHWERTKKAYDCLTHGLCQEEFTDVVQIVKECYKNKETDEFILPRKLVGYKGIKEHDGIIFFNFRTDRSRQLTQALIEKNFAGWRRKPLNIFYVAMTPYYQPMKAAVAFPEERLTHLLGEVISQHHLTQLRISETEKYAHITYFFNGQKEKPFPGEERILVPSPKVPTYDLKPKMSVYEITKTLIKKINSQKYDFIVVNLVNGDMVGHTGKAEAIKKAIQAVDDCVGKIASASLKNKYTLFLFGDHGNAEDQTPKWRTSHTTNPVPFILVSDDKHLLKSGKGLQDVAPTVLKRRGIPKPREMTGKSLF